MSVFYRSAETSTDRDLPSFCWQKGGQNTVRNGYKLTVMNWYHPHQVIVTYGAERRALQQGNGVIEFWQVINILTAIVCRYLLFLKRFRVPINDIGAFWLQYGAEI